MTYIDDLFKSLEVANEDFLNALQVLPLVEFTIGEKKLYFSSLSPMSYSKVKDWLVKDISGECGFRKPTSITVKIVLSRGWLDYVLKNPEFPDNVCYL